MPSNPDPARRVRFPWTAATLGTLRTMRAEGATDLEIADRIGCSPTAARRQGDVCGYPRGARPVAAVAAETGPDPLEQHRRAHPQLYARRPQPSRDASDAPGRFGLVEPLPPSRTCCWISGDTAQPGWTYCGRKSVRGLSWCGEHARRAIIRWPAAGTAA
jgi:hypothetical protein